MFIQLFNLVHLYFCLFLYIVLQQKRINQVPEIITQGASEISKGALVLMHVSTYFVPSIAMVITM